LETRRWNGTKPAFADYAAAPMCVPGRRRCICVRAARCRSRLNRGHLPLPVRERVCALRRRERAPADTQRTPVRRSSPAVDPPAAPGSRLLRRYRPPPPAPPGCRRWILIRIDGDRCR